jgi:hypothetical protein
MLKLRPWFFLTFLLGSVLLTAAPKSSDPHTTNKLGQSTPFTLTANVVNPSCNTEGSITTVITGGTAPFTYIWNTGATTSAITNLLGGNYSVTVADAFNTIEIASFTLNNSMQIQPIDIINTSGAPGNNVCSGGTVVFGSNIISGGTAPYTYTWTATPSMSFIGNNNTGNSVGIQFVNEANQVVPVTVQVFATDATGCTTSTSIIMNAAADLTFTIATLESSGTSNDGVICYGNTVDLAPQGVPSEPLSYNWNTGATNGVITITPPYDNSNTNYTLTVTNSVGCSSQALVGVTGIEQVYGAVWQLWNCTGTSPTTMGFNGIGGTPPYLLNISNVNYGFQFPISYFPVNEPAGVILYPEATDQNGCPVDGLTPFYLIIPPSLSATSTVIPANCFTNTGTITINPIGGDGTFGYFYEWSNGMSTQQVEVGPGTYTVTVYDSYNCTTTLNVVMTQPLPVINMQVQNITNGLPAPSTICSGGRLIINSNYPNAIYPNGYQWSISPYMPYVQYYTYGPAVAYTFTNTGNTPLPVTVTVQVTDIYGCVASQSIVITVLPAASFDIDYVESSGAPNDGIACFGDPISLVATGLTGSGLTYLWSNGQTTETTSVIPSGLDQLYSLTVTNSSQCTSTGTVIVSALSEIIGNVTAPVSCSTMAPTELVYDVSGGLPPYMISVNGSSFGTQSSPFNFTSSEAPGSVITVETTDAYGCTGAVDFEIPPYATPIEITETIVPATCTSLGSISLEVSSGVAPYSFLWDNGSTTASITNLNPGAYTVIVTDINGCTSTESYDILVPTTPQTVYLDADSDGFGDPAFVYSGCNPPAGYTASVSGDCNDANGSIYPGAIEVCNQLDDNCDGIVDEELPVQVWYLDIDADGYGQTLTFISSCGPTGQYTASVGGDCQDLNPNIRPNAIDICNGIDDNCNGVIDEFGNFDVVPTVWNVSCFGTPNGRILISNIAPAGAYTYLWSTGATTQNILNIPVGTYTITVTHTVSGCTVTKTRTVVSPTLIVVSLAIEQKGNPNNPKYKVTVSATGGAPYAQPNPYRYRYNVNGGSYTAWGTDKVFNNLQPGTYNFQVRDSRNCIKTKQEVLPSSFTSQVLTKLANAQVNPKVIESVKGLRLFPNPAHNQISVWLEDVPEGGGKVSITDMMGNIKMNIPYESMIKGDEKYINLDGFASGVYLFHFEPNQARKITRKFVVISE